MADLENCAAVPARSAAGCAWGALVAAVAAVGPLLDDELVAAHDLTLTEFDALFHAGAAASEPVTVTGLAMLLPLSRSRASRVVAALEERRLVRREVCPGDTRAVQVRLTEAGRAALDAALPTFERVVDERLGSRLAPEELARLSELGRRVAADRVPAEVAVPPRRGRRARPVSRAGAAPR